MCITKTSFIETSNLKTLCLTKKVTISAFDYIGYLRITDFGIARVWRPDNSQDTSGNQATWVRAIQLTLLAPEVMCRQNHGVAVDYFAAGVMAFECMYGRVSFTSKIYIIEAICW
jgi:serine/threonine protein kinase